MFEIINYIPVGMLKQNVKQKNEEGNEVAIKHSVMPLVYTFKKDC